MASPQKFIIRPAQVKDARGIAEVHVGSWRETYPGIVPQGTIDLLSVEDKEKTWSERLQEAAPADRFTFVAEVEGGRIVGFATGGPVRKHLFEGLEQPASKTYESELMAIYSFKEFHGQGMGKALFEAVTAELRRLGHKGMLIAVLKGNPTQGFYERMGGTAVGTIKVEIGTWLDEVVYGWEEI